MSSREVLDAYGLRVPNGRGLTSVAVNCGDRGMLKWMYPHSGGSFPEWVRLIKKDEKPPPIDQSDG